MGYALYHTDGYRRTLDTTVTAVDGDRVALAATIFYARSGGQVSDHGTLTWPGGAARIVEVRHADGVTWHQVEGDIPAVGAAVHGALDWERRYALMRMHTATHIMNGVIWRDYGALVTGASVDVAQGRLDFELDRMSAELAAEVEERMNAEVAADRAVLLRFLPRAEIAATPGLFRSKWVAPPEGLDAVRIVEIEGLDMQACGGTHVARTGEVGRIRVVGRESKGKMNKRLRIALD